jgi:hypothetical protein
MRNFGTVCLDFFTYNFLIGLGAFLYHPYKSQQETGWVYGTSGQRKCVELQLSPMFFISNQPFAVVVCCFWAFHGFFIYVTIFYHVHMIVPFPVMCNIYSILFIACTACPVWMNWWKNMKLLWQLWEEWTCSLNLVEIDRTVWPTYIYIYGITFM